MGMVDISDVDVRFNILYDADCVCRKQNVWEARSNIYLRDPPPRLRYTVKMVVTAYDPYIIDSYITTCLYYVRRMTDS